MWTIFSSTWYQRTELIRIDFFPLYFTVPQTSFSFTNIFTSLPIKGNISLVSSGFLTSAYNFKNDFTINCQQSFFYTSCWLTVIIHIIKHKIFERNENPRNYWFHFLYINGIFKHVPFAGLWSLSPGSDTCPTEHSADPEWSCTASGFPLLSH